MQGFTTTVQLPDDLNTAIKQAISEAAANAESLVARNSEFPMYMTKAQTADYLGISLNTLDKWIKSDVGIPFKFIGGSYRFNRVAVDRFMLNK